MCFNCRLKFTMLCSLLRQSPDSPCLIAFAAKPAAILPAFFSTSRRHCSPVTPCPVTPLQNRCCHRRSPSLTASFQAQPLIHFGQPASSSPCLRRATCVGPPFISAHGHKPSPSLTQAAPRARASSLLPNQGRRRSLPSDPSSTNDDAAQPTPSPVQISK